MTLDKAKAGMSRNDARNMCGKSVLSSDGLCCICRKAPRLNRHHIVPRSRGGANGPVVDVCGMGNTGGCHGKLHTHRLLLLWDSQKWLVREWDGSKPPADLAELDGWRPL